MKLPQLTLRDLFWLVLVAAMGCGWWVERNRPIPEPQSPLPAGRYQIHSPYPHGLQILCCDSSVGTVPTEHVPDVLPRILSIGGGEPRELYD